MTSSGLGCCRRLQNMTPGEFDDPSAQAGLELNCGGGVRSNHVWASSSGSKSMLQ